MKHLLLVVALLPILSAYSQCRIIINPETGNQKLPYATVTNISAGTVFSADKEGQFELIAKEGDTIKVSYVGHNSNTFIYNGDKQKNIRLTEIAAILPEIILKPCEKYKSEIQINQNDRKEKQRGFRGIGYSYGLGRNEYAVLLKPKEPGSFLKTFSFWLVTSANPKGAEKAPFIITFYSVNDSTNLPNSESICKPIFYFPKEIGRQTIKLDSISIHIPENGIYVGFQYVMDEKFAWYGNRIPGVLDSSFRRYGVCVEGAYETGTVLASFNNMAGQWYFDNPKYSIKYVAVLKYCKK